MDLDDSCNSAPLRFRAVDNLLGPASPPGLAERELAPEPTTAEEAKQSKEWRTAMLEEMASIEHKTW